MRFFKVAGCVIVLVATTGRLLEDSTLVEEQDLMQSKPQGAAEMSGGAGPSRTSAAPAASTAGRAHAANGGNTDRPSAGSASTPAGAAGMGTNAAPAPGGAPGTAVIAARAAGMGVAATGTGGRAAAGSSMGMSDGSGGNTAAGSSTSLPDGTGGKSAAAGSGMDMSGEPSGGSAMGGGHGTWSMVYDALFASSAVPGCGACHSGAANPSLNGGFAGLMDKDSAYSALVGKISSSAMCSGKIYVKAGDPDGSLNIFKVPRARALTLDVLQLS